MESANKESNKAFYNTRRDDDRRRFAEQGSKRFLGEVLVDWIAPQLQRGAVVLDIAGGSGIYASQIGQAAGASVVGVDISESMVRQRGEDPFLPLSVVGDMEALPFASEAFDAVVFIAALHHVPDALPALREAFRVLRPGGRLYAREPCSLRAGATSAAPIAGHAEEFRISMPYLADRTRRAGFELDALISVQLTMRLLGRVVRSPSLELYRASYRADRLLLRLPGLARLGEGCMLEATKPGAGVRVEREELAALLACPRCGGALAESSGELACAACGARYGESGGVRVLLPPEPLQPGAAR